VEEKEQDYVMLSDIFATGWHATELAGLRPGESVVIFGCGPVGLMAAHSAMIKGASKVIIVDRHPDRLELARKIGVIAIDDSKSSPVEEILELTGGEGADCGCECVGYQCHDPAGHEVPNMTMNALVQSVRPTGGIGVVGVFVSEDPGSKDELEREGKLAFDFGTFFEKGQHMATGQCNVKAYNRYLRNLIHTGRARPSWIISHELSLDEAPDAYKHFDSREKGWTKVILHPQQQRNRARAQSMSARKGHSHAAHAE
jgi:glutathione-independent formaldehyde dehydrogenase